MGAAQDGQPDHDWSNSGRWGAFLRGSVAAFSIPVLVVTISYIGFGALARDLGFDVWQAVVLAAGMFALPGQVVLVDQAAKGAGMAATALAVTMTSIRLLPLAFSLFPLMRSARTSRWVELLLAHFVAITVWLESMRRFPGIPRELRAAFFAGFVLTMAFVLSVATAVGHGLASRVPDAVAAGMVFLTPIYFTLSLIEGARFTADRIALVLGGVLGPVMYLLLPGFDLLLTGLVGGTAAYLAARWKRRNGAP